MKRTTLLAAIAVTFTSFGALAYSESDETRIQDSWWAQERMLNDGYGRPEYRTSKEPMHLTCPSAAEQKRTAEFLQQLQLTDGGTGTTPGVLQRPPSFLSAAEQKRTAELWQQIQLTDGGPGVTRGNFQQPPSSAEADAAPPRQGRELVAMNCEGVMGRSS